MSTDKQEDSPARQRRDIEDLAKRQGFRILSWYEDHGLTGTDSENRPEFLKLLNDAKSRKFSAVLISEQSRMSREDIFDAMLHWRRLRDAGVSIVTCQRGELDFENLGGMITAIVDQYGARQESIKLAERVVSGQRNRSLAGKRIGGITFGYDREILDESKEVVKVVHFRDRFRTPSSWESRLVTSADTKAVKAIQWAFDAACRGKSIGAIMREFNRRNLKTTYNKPFSHPAIRGILVNPTYAGRISAGRHSRGKFVKLNDGDLIVVEDAHEAIVPPEKFERVQQILDKNKGRFTRHKFQIYMLGGILHCDHCGGRMHGVIIRNPKPGYTHSWYQCAKVSRAKRLAPCECNPTVRVDRLEKAVLDIMCDQVLTERSEPRIRKAIVRATQRDKTKITTEQRKLKNVRSKIERATENLALASDEDFAGIAKLLSKWRDEEARLSLAIERQTDNLEALPEAMKVLSKLARIRDNLDLADREALSAALRQTIDRITIRNEFPTTGEITHRVVIAEIHLNPLVNGGGVIPIHSELLSRKRGWMLIRDLAKSSKHPIHLKEVMELIGTKDSSLASFQLRQAVKAGVVVRLPKQAGWVAKD